MKIISTLMISSANPTTIILMMKNQDAQIQRKIGTTNGMYHNVNVNLAKLEELNIGNRTMILKLWNQRKQTSPNIRDKRKTTIDGVRLLKMVTVSLTRLINLGNYMTQVDQQNVNQVTNKSKTMNCSISLHNNETTKLQKQTTSRFGINKSYL